jgi:hypothetical protein
MNWTELDWESLDKHRERFLEGRPSDGPYWESAEDLSSYDLTFGERIGWKWDAVLTELRMHGWKPPVGNIVDWGCGSGIAGRRVIARFGRENFESLIVADHSPYATDFAQEAAAAMFPGLPVSAATPSYIHGTEAIGLLVVSHVLNELPPGARDEVMSLVARSRAVIWTEPGSRETSRALGAIRDGVIGEFKVVAPCTHMNACPVLGNGNERHWCHFFASPPPGIFADSNWVKFGQRAGIDLRSLPYSFLALDRRWRAPDGNSRVIGRPESFKPYLRLLNCDGGGLKEIEITKRSAPGLNKEMPKEKLPLVYKWERIGSAISGGSHPKPREAQSDYGLDPPVTR